jgi:hypothetical protein
MYTYVGADIFIVAIILGSIISYLGLKDELFKKW